MSTKWFYGFYVFVNDFLCWAAVMSHLGQQLGNVNALLIGLSLLGSSVISQDNNTDHLS